MAKRCKIVVQKLKEYRTDISKYNILIHLEKWVKLTSVVDFSNFGNFHDPENKTYLENLVIPEALKKISSKLTVNSTGYLPSLNPEIELCMAAKGLHLSFFNYRNPQEGDFLLVVGNVNVPAEFMAFASFCSQGNIILINSYQYITYVRKFSFIDSNQFVNGLFQENSFYQIKLT